MYNVTSDNWQPAPAIKKARAGHSSCSLQKYIYIFGAWNDDSWINNIERIDMGALTAGRWFVKW